LILSPLLLSDASTLFAYRSDPNIYRYQTWEPRTVEDAQHFIASLQHLAFDTPGTWFQLGIRLRENGTLVGDLGVHFIADDPHQVEIGFTLAPAYQGRGIGTEAVRALLSHLFGVFHKHRVFASVDPRNAPSIALLKRIGMRQEAHFRESLWFKGEWVDDLVFAILESEWRGLPSASPSVETDG
jgi:RimJ/RimL family protein N-acetyltransferase